MRTLIIGYGNTLRSDDGAGPALIAALEKRMGGSQGRDWELVSCMQLTPELAAVMARSQQVIFADASVQLPAGKVTIRRIKANGAAPLNLHQYGPDQLVQLCREIFDFRPEAWVVAIGVATLEIGDILSAATANVVERLAGHLSHRLCRLQSVVEPATTAHRELNRV
ncbi:MAG: hydrogenase maturation protease [Phycisphaerae bacterium]